MYFVAEENRIAYSSKVLHVQIKEFIMQNTGKTVHIVQTNKENSTPCTNWTS